jgi:DNA polymerase-3 subunit alpha
VFQFESPGMNALIRGIQVERFEEVVAANALYRPGPMGIGAHEEYIKNKFEPEKIEYVHPALEPILAETNGVLVFQEQLMFIADKIGGMGLGRGDMLRRFMDKASKIIDKNSSGQELDESEKNNKNWKGFQEYWNEFLEGAANQGYKKEEVDKIKDWVIKYLGYSFNKSHALSYSYLAMQTLYLKHYYPTEFYTALLNHPKDSGDKEDQKEWMAAAIASAMSKGITIKRPSRKSGWDWTVTGDHEISMGFSGINGLGDIAYEELITMVKRTNKTLDKVSMIEFFDLPFSKFNKSAFEACVKAGVFDDWSTSREFLLSMKAKKRKKQPENQMALFDMGSEDFDMQIDSSEYMPTTEDKKILDFEEVCNFNLENIQRITKIKEEMNAKASKKGNVIESVMNYTEAGWYFFVIEDYWTDISRNGNKYMTLTISDGISKRRIRAFDNIMKKLEPIIERKGFYVAKFYKNKKGFMNFDGKTKIRRYETNL